MGERKMGERKMGERKMAERRAKRQAAGADCKLQNENLKLRICNWQSRLLGVPSPSLLHIPFYHLPFSAVKMGRRWAFSTLHDKVESAGLPPLCPNSCWRKNPAANARISTGRRAAGPTGITLQPLGLSQAPEALAADFLDQFVENPHLASLCSGSPTAAVPSASLSPGSFWCRSCGMGCPSS